MAILIKGKLNRSTGIWLVPRTKVDRIEARLARELRPIFYKIVDSVIDKYKPFAKAEAKNPIPQINVDAIGQPYENDIYASISRHKRSAVKTTAVAMSKQFKVPLDVRYYNAYVEDVVMNRTFKIVSTQITPQIGKQLQTTIDAAIKQGASNTQLVKNLNMLKTNYKTIARTEINTAANEAGFMMSTKELNELGIISEALKEWHTANDEKVRDAHIQAGFDYGPGNGIPVEEPFDGGGEPLMYPGDYAGGSAGNIINCRCNPKITFKGLQ